MFIQRPSELLIAPIQSPDYQCIWFFPSDIGFASALSSWWSYCDDRPLVKQWPIVAVFCLRMISTMGWLLSSCSHPSRHRAHGQELDVGVRVLGTGPEAVHGRLRRHPGNEQCQAFPLPGKQNILSTLWIESTQLVFFTDSSEPTMKRSTCHWHYVLRTSELGIFVFYGLRRKACALLYLYYLNIWELNKVLYYRALYPHKKTIFPHYGWPLLVPTLAVVTSRPGWGWP